jgi:hypothetical protein
VASACAPIEAVYVPADAACNGSVMVQLPSAAMFAPLKETAVELFVSERAAPVHVVDGAGAGASVSPGGSATCRLDWVSAKPLAFAIVTVSVDAEFGATVAGEKFSVTVGGSGVTASGAGQALFGPPELDGAELVAVLAVSVTVSVSLFPALSVTVSMSVPGDGSMVTLAVAAPLTMMPAGTADQAKEAMASATGVAAPASQPATLELASTTLPAPRVAGSTMTAMGFCAALTDASASTMPAPH